MGDFAPYESVTKRYRGGRDHSLDPDKSEEEEEEADEEPPLALGFVGIGFNADEDGSKTEEDAQPTPRELTDYTPEKGGDGAQQNAAKDKDQGIGDVLAEKFDKCAIT